MRRIAPLFSLLVAGIALIGCSSATVSETDDPTTDSDGAESRVDERVARLFPEFFPPGVAHSIPLDAIVHGGPPKDGIPALTEPKIVPAARADYLEPDDIVLGVVRNGEARAYPFKIMNWHEIANDTLGGERIVVTYCPLCGTGIAFDPTVKGKIVEFGVSGLLHNSDLLMYDRGTETPSLWQQATGEAVVGPLTGTRLKRIPITHATWEDWVRQNPTTTVLSTETGYRRNYARDPYAGYAETEELFFGVRGERRDLPRKTWVFGLLVNGEARAYPLDRIRREGVVNDVLGGEPILLLSTGGEPGTVRAYRRGERSFRGSAANLTDEAGTVWKMTEEALVAPSGERLERLEEGFVAFWFAWAVFYPHTSVYPTDAKAVEPADGEPNRWGKLKGDDAE